MAQIMPKDYSFGEDLGTRMGKNIEAISNHKLNEMFQRYEQNRIDKARKEGNWGALPEEEQRELRQMYPKMYYGPETYAKMQDYGQTSLGQPEQQSPQIGQESMQGDQEQQAALNQGLERMLGQRPSMDMINQVLAGQTNTQAGSMMRNAYGSPQGTMQYPDLGTEMMQKLQAQPRRQQVIDPMEQEMPLEQSSLQQYERTNMPMTQAQRFQDLQNQRKSIRHATERAYNQAREDITKLEQERKVYANNKRDYNELMAYNEGGGEISGAPLELLRKLGLENVFTTPTSQAAGKVAQKNILDRLENTRGISRGTNMAFNILGSSGPNLLLSPLGQKAVIGSLRNLEEYKDIIAEKLINEKKRYVRAGIIEPPDLETKVIKHMKPYFDKMEKKDVALWDQINRESKATYQVVERGLDKPNDPTTYNTLKDQIYFDDPSRPGKYVGSDGKKQYEVVKRNGKLILVK